MPDKVDHPAHYGGADNVYEVINIIEHYNLGFCDGNVLKYLLRWRAKGGIEDLHKAAWYLNRFIQQNTKAHDSNSSR